MRFVKSSLRGRSLSLSPSAYSSPAAAAALLLDDTVSEFGQMLVLLLVRLQD